MEEAAREREREGGREGEVSCLEDYSQQEEEEASSERGEDRQTLEKSGGGLFLARSRVSAFLSTFPEYRQEQRTTVLSALPKTILHRISEDL